MPTTETPTSHLLSIAVGASAGIAGPPTSPPNPQDRYRWYSCIQNPIQTICVQVENPEDMHFLEEKSRIVLIPKWVPSRFDRHLVSYKMWQDHTTVIKPQQNPTEVQK